MNEVNEVKMTDFGVVVNEVKMTNLVVVINVVKVMGLDKFYPKYHKFS